MAETKEKDTFLGARGKAMAAKLLASLWSSGRLQSLRVAAYGCGADYQAFCEAIPGFKESLKALLDDSGAKGTVPLSQIPRLGIDCAVLCSATHQEPMRAKLRSSGFKGEIVLPYEQNAETGTLGLFSWRPEDDWPQPSRPQAQRGKIPGVPRIRKILLFHPPFAKANARHKKTMPLGLLLLAAAIRRSLPNVSLELYDAHIAKHSWDEAKAHVDARDFDLLLCSYWSAQAEPAYLMSEHVMRSRNAAVIHGGAHATLCPEEASGHCHKAVCGEGEALIVELVRHLDSGRRIEDFPSSAAALLDDLDSLPFPAWDLLEDPKAYDHPMHVVGGWRFPILGSRGCPFNCSFCSSPLLWKGKVRWRSPGNVADEMDDANRRFGVDRFHFWDDNFLLSLQHAQGLCEELLKRGRSYLWCGLSRASDILRRQDLLPLLKKAGCVGIEIGVESFSDQVSKATGKGEFAAETAQAAKAISGAGIVPLYTHMLFVPGETASSYAEKERFLSKLSAGIPNQCKSDASLGQLATPHVATRFAKEAHETGLVLWKGSPDSFHHRVNFIPKSLLDDTPERKAGAAMPPPLPWLSKIVQSVYDWTQDDMRGFVKAAKPLWDSIDGSLSVRALSEAVSAKCGMPFEKAAVFTSLLVVGWAREGLVFSQAKPKEGADA